VTSVDHERPAFYALPSGGWRDYWTLLHPPYTVWHLSYVVLGASVAPALNWARLEWSLLGFFLGMGITAHCLDELNGRPLRTRIPSPVLKALAIGGVAGAVALGVMGAIQVTAWLLVFVAFGGFIVVAYNLELFGGAFHSDLWFALSWGAFPAVTAAFAQDGVLRWPAIVIGAACFVLSVTQRTLSTPVRRLRRSIEEVEGRVILKDGSVEALDPSSLRAAPEIALRTLSAAVPLLALAAVGARVS
jgi:hypothetical protein